MQFAEKTHEAQCLNNHDEFPINHNRYHRHLDLISYLHQSETSTIIRANHGHAHPTVVIETHTSKIKKYNIKT